ncbi:tetratricopeptide repeat protein [Nitzschia inconspicua]|uniref:Tetratricopeptide repeat protein n=1 Tax=Nitzschia inconspicua TaxID=303405 RepID=A0A9K3L7H0_9STRA|nr:tetratricopeptide repeat protein [Nitzschia inconspicua]
MTNATKRDELNTKNQMKCSSSRLDLSIVASSTRMGIMSFQNRDFERAQSCFISALHNIEGKMFGESGTAVLRNSMISQMIGVGEKRPSSFFTSSPQPESLSCSKDCDEGIYSFHDAFMFSEEATLPEISTTLVLNVAQTFLRMKLFVRAGIWFRQALLETRECMSSDTPLGMSEHILATKTYSCIGVLFFKLTEPDTESALTFFRKCLAIYHYHPTTCSPKKLATLLNNFGRVFYLKGKWFESINFYQQSLALRRQEIGDASIDVAATLYNLGNSHHKLKNWEQAIACYDEFLIITEIRLGLRTREVAFVHKCKAEILQELKEPDAALRHYDEALKFSKTAFGDDCREVGCILNEAGNLCFEEGRYHEALKYYSWGLHVEKSRRERDESLTLVTLANIAQTYKHLGQTEMALNFYRQVYNIQTRTFGTSMLEIASTLSSIGMLLFQLKHYEEAFDTYQKALEIKRDHHGSDEHAAIASTLNAMGLILFKQGRHEICMWCFRECLGIRRKLFGPDHRDVAMAWYNLASVSLETGDDEIALQQYEEALRVEKMSLGDEHPDIILTMIHLGQVKQQCGLLNEAIATFEEALCIQRSQPEGDQMLAARIYNFIGNCLLQKGDILNMMKAFAEASRISLRMRCFGESLSINGYNLYGLSKLHPECAPAA